MKLAPDAPTGLGAAMAGGKARLATTERRELDYYPTPPEATRALILAEHRHFAPYVPAAWRDHEVWEPCGRGGAIARELVRQLPQLRVTATDIVPDPANAVAALDLLQAKQLLAPIVITNPPFALAGRMIAHLLDQLHAPYVALLLKTQFWSTDTEGGRGRLGLFRRHPPNWRWDCTWRVDFTGQENSTMNVSWFIWDIRRRHEMGWGLLSRTGPVETTDLFGE